MIYVKHSVHLETYVQELQSSSGQNSLPKKKKKINFLKENCLKNLFSKMESLKKKIQIFKDCFLGEIMNTDFKAAPFT